MVELKLFILRAEGRRLYREFMRALRMAPVASRPEIRAQVRLEFEKKKQQKDVYSVKYSLSDGRTQLRMLKEMLAMQR